MKKFLLGLLIGMVLVMDLCGIVKEVIDNFEKEEVIDRSFTIVYMEQLMLFLFIFAEFTTYLMEGVPKWCSL